jgi:hemerythrin-like domain-containing protein
MDNQKSATTAASGRAAMIITDSTAVLPQVASHLLQNFLLIWLDANLDEAKEDFENSIQHLRCVVATIATFTDVDECIDFLSDIENEKVFMIVSGALGQHLIPEIQAWQQLQSIYIFCDNQSIHEEWAKTISKVKGVYTKIEPICEALQIDREHCDRDLIPISFHGIDPLFMYTQLLKETFLEIDDDDDKSVKELADYCRLQGDISKDHIDKLEQEYRLHQPIWWYTAPYFMFSMLNRGLRLMDVDIILRMSFFIRQLHRHIENLHCKQQLVNTTSTSFQVFRGQSLPIEEF